MAVAFSGKIIWGLLAPRGDTKTHAHASHTHSNNTPAATAGVGHVATRQHRGRRPAPINAPTTAQTLGKLTPSRSWGAHVGGHGGARSRACNGVCCAASLLASPINRARTTPSRLPSEVCTGAFGGAKGAALLIDGDEAQGDQVHPPPMS